MSDNNSNTNDQCGLPKVPFTPSHSQSEETFQFTEFTTDNRILTKKIGMDSEGKIIKYPGQITMARGIAKTVSMTLPEFSEYLMGLGLNQAIGHGICEFEKIIIVSMEALADKTYFQVLVCILWIRNYVHAICCIVPCRKNGSARASMDNFKNKLEVIPRTKDYFNYSEGPTPLNTCPGLRLRWRPLNSSWRSVVCCLPSEKIRRLSLLQKSGGVYPMTTINIVFEAQYRAYILDRVRLRTPVTRFALGLLY